MFSSLHPIDLALDIAKFKFSFILKIFKGFLVLIALSWMVPGQAALTILHNTIPSPTISKNYSESESIGR
jgi:hypothetical protein